MPIPKYGDLANALLCFVFLNGGETYQVSAKDTYKPLADYFALNETERNRPRPDGHSGRGWDNKVQWTRQKLINDGFMEKRGHGNWGLTKAGVNRANTLVNKFRALKV